jgi:hypothetical protein
MAKSDNPAAVLPKHHAERLQFPTLIAKNPNYFGNFPELKLQPVLELSNDTTFEELTCVGYNPERGILEAVIQVKQPTGYLGNACTPGSFEYIRFFVDTGSGFTDAGLAAINVHDIPNANDCAQHPEKPISYSASISYTPPNSEDCDDPVLPVVRAVLSWQTIPPANNPNFNPIWGNHLDCHIQLAPGPFTIGDFIEDLLEGGVKLPPLAAKFAGVAKVPIPGPDPAPLGLPELAKLYQEGPAAKIVPSHRFGFSEVHKVMKAPVVSSQVVSNKIAEFAALKLNWAEIVGAVEKTSADTSFEQLDCLGLEGSVGFERLVATFRVKQQLGYSGDLCTAGSFEYVAFWADWENKCQYTYLGTVPVRVHDLKRKLPEDICYTAVLPVDLSQHRLGCELPKIGRVRAVLSWAVPPSTTDPNQLNTWGNLIDTHVQIQPGVSTNPLNPKISILGGIPTSQIDPTTGFTTPFARFAGNNLLADDLGRACPFGGRVEVQGPEFPGYKYRIQVRDVTVGGTWQTVITPLMLTRWDGTTYTSNPDINGYFEYQQYINNIENLLGNWDSSGDDLWEVKLEIADLGDNPVLGAIPDLHLMQLDNTAPFASVDITTGGGDCGKFPVGTVLGGTFVARDVNFGSFSLGTLPFNGPITPSSGSVQTPIAGSAWSLNTAGMKSCGYVVELDVADRSIVNSSWGAHNRRPASTGYCLI